MVQCLGKYKLFAEIGHGGMADIFLALSKGTMGIGKLVVIKKMHRALAADPAFVEMFMDEARIALRLNHPNVVNSFDVGEEGGIRYLAMEYLEGQPFARVLAACHESRRAFSYLHQLWVVRNALEGLHYAHELADHNGAPLNLVHRDISPKNIFVTYDGQVKILDFGVAKANLNLAVTAAGSVKGTTGYMAPEQVRGQGIDRRADLFAMGVVLWEVVTRQRLFTGDTIAVINRILHEPVPSVSTVIQGVPEKLEAIVTRALQKDPADRYQSAAEMRKDLDEYIQSTGQSIANEHLSERMCTVFASQRLEIKAHIQQCVSESDTKVSALPVEGVRDHAIGVQLPGLSLEASSVGSGIGPAAREGSGVRSSESGTAGTQSRSGALVSRILSGLIGVSPDGTIRAGGGLRKLLSVTAAAAVFVFVTGLWAGLNGSSSSSTPSMPTASVVSTIDSDSSTPGVTSTDASASISGMTSTANSAATPSDDADRPAPPRSRFAYRAHRRALMLPWMALIWAPRQCKPMFRQDERRLFSLSAGTSHEAS